VKLLAFSDLHRDLGQAARLVELSEEADVVAGVGDFASIHEGLGETIEALKPITKPTVLVPGNNETEAALREAAGGWATVLHGGGAEIEGIDFFGIGAGVPVTPWEWSFDLTEDEAEAKLSACPENAVLLSHSPPKGHVDKGLGSEAVLRAAEGKRPRLVLCGHIHELWGQESRIGEARVMNLGPSGTFIDL
jgi:Icc-related predicted phosphoesterase